MSAHLAELQVSCEGCGGTGRQGAAACPGCGGVGLRAVQADELPDGDTYVLLLAAELAEHGTWPLAGGWFAQTVACVQAVRFVWDEQARWRDQRTARYGAA